MVSTERQPITGVCGRAPGLQATALGQGIRGEVPWSRKLFCIWTTWWVGEFDLKSVFFAKLKISSDVWAPSCRWPGSFSVSDFTVISYRIYSLFNLANSHFLCCHSRSPSNQLLFVNHKSLSASDSACRPMLALRAIQIHVAYYYSM